MPETDTKDLKKTETDRRYHSGTAGGAHRDPAVAASNLEHYLAETLTKLKRVPIEKLLHQRYEKLRHLGEFFRSSPSVSAVKAKTAHRTD